MTGRSRAVTVWVLERFVGGPERDAVIGDIVEQSASRPVAWLWWQTFMAISTDTAREMRAHAVVLPFAVFCIGFGAAVALGTIRLLPGSHVLDQMLTGIGAGGAVGRLGRLPAVVTFAVIVLILTVASSPAMSLVDHFGRAWWLADRGLRALPDSLALAQVSIAAGGLWSASRAADGPARRAA